MTDDLNDYSKKKVVVSIDYGTAGSGFAYCRIQNPDDIIRYTKWGGDIPYCKTISSILYDKKIPKYIGHEAMKDYVENHSTNYTIISNAKLRFIESPTQRFKETESSPEMSPIEIVSDYLREMNKVIQSQFDKAGIKVSKEEIRYVVSVPSNYEEHHKKSMKEAIFKAGITSEISPVENDCIIVHENEAAAVRCMKYMNEESYCLEDGDYFIVVDAGGGTVDISSHQIQNGKLHEKTRRNTSLGSSNINDKFFEYLESLIGTVVIKAYKSENELKFFKMMQLWEKTKCNTTELKEQNFVLTNHFSKFMQKNGIELPNEIFDEDENALILSKEKMSEFFLPCIGDIENRISSHLNDLGHEVKFIFVVGGFSQSNILISILKSKFETKEMKLIVPPFPGDAVLVGNAMLGVDCSLIRTRRSLFSYGISTNKPFRKGDNIDLTEQSPTGFVIPGCFSKFVTADDEVDIDESFEKTFPINDPKKSVLEVKVYLSTKKDPKMVVDEKKLGIVKVPVVPGKDKSMKITFFIGKADLQVIAEDRDGNKTKSDFFFQSESS
jgi:molecular chaperone DnaK (HSP70)